MQITVKINDTVVYQRLTDDAKAPSRAIAFLMQQPAGEGVTTSIVNGGNDFVFRHTILDVGQLVRHVEGITVRNKAA